MAVDYADGMGECRGADAEDVSTQIRVILYRLLVCLVWLVV